MKLETFVAEVVNQVRAGAKAAKAMAPDVIHLEVPLNADGDLCGEDDRVSTMVKFNVYPQR